MKESLLILGDQLYPIAFYKDHQKKNVFMAEDKGLCTHYKYHKHKLLFFLSSMRNYRDELREHDFTVHYEDFSDKPFTQRLEEYLKKQKIKAITHVEVDDKFFEHELNTLFKKLEIEVTVLQSPKFLGSRQEFKNYLFYHPKPFMKTFYEKERKRLNILMSKNKKPEGNQWSFDAENRKGPPKELTCEKPVFHKRDSHFETLSKLINKEFPDHPGLTDDFWLPTDRKGALKNLRHFLNHHLVDFGTYQDSITNRAPFLYHSIISPMLNNGLLLPQEVIEKALDAREKNADIPLHSLEGFIRQVMGWREFVFGIYQNFSDKEEKGNFFKHERRLSAHWYKGTTGLLPVDDAITKAFTLGYCHHIERLMILSNAMLLCELHPKEVHKWFMEFFVDSADWVMGPNVYGMGQFSDGGLFATKPYISGSNYILKMSDYKKGDWCEVWDGLYWRFISKNRAFFEKNPRLSMMVRTFDKMDKEKQDKHIRIADKFIQEKTLG